jgi:nitrilase
VTATVDLNEEIILKRAHDIVGTYNRFDIFDLRVDKRRRAPITTIEQDDSEPARDRDAPRERDASPLFDLSSKEVSRDVR